MSKYAKSLPVITYHFINNCRAGLTVSPALFEEHCRFLAEKGWRGVGLEEAEAFWLHGEPLPQKSFLITLDDGYLDNYVYAWPILRKYGHKAVIFAVTTPINNAQQKAEAENVRLRPTLQDVWDGRISAQALPPVDDIIQTNKLGYKERHDIFFTWDEARLMEQSGVISIAGHSLGHAGIFTGAEYNGFFQPESSTIAFSHVVDGGFWGRPRFMTGSELRDKMFLPSETMLNSLKEAVPQDTDKAFAFFRNENNVKALEKLAKSFASNPGRMETDEEQQERLFSVMQKNQNILQKELGHKVTSFSWPWGHRCELALAAGEAAGFKVFFTVEKGPNPVGSARTIRRMNYKDNVKKMLSRMKIYSSPLLSAIYMKVRI